MEHYITSSLNTKESSLAYKPCHSCGYILTSSPEKLPRNIAHTYLVNPAY